MRWPPRRPAQPQSPLPRPSSVANVAPFIAKCQCKGGGYGPRALRRRGGASVDMRRDAVASATSGPAAESSAAPEQRRERRALHREVPVQGRRVRPKGSPASGRCECRHAKGCGGLRDVRPSRRVLCRARAASRTSRPSSRSASARAAGTAQGLSGVGEVRV